MFHKNSLASRIVLALALASMAGESAAAGITDISNVPLATSGGTSILPNLLFDLDDSGSMDWDFMPDYVSPQTGGVALTQSVPCMKNSSGSTDCSAGDPPFRAGGAHGFNGVAYDPNFYYKPGINENGQPLLNPPSGLPLGNPVSTTSVPNDVYSHNPYGSSTTTVNLATQIPDSTYCNKSSGGVCKRSGADTKGVVVSGTSYFDASNGANSGSSLAMTAGLFPYRTNPSNASTAIFGLPEMMSIASFTGNGSTATATTVEPHGLVTGDSVYVFVTSSNALNATCVPVTVTSATTFTYSSTSGSTATSGSYRKCVNLTSSAAFSRSSTTVTVYSPAHGLVSGDVITTANTGSIAAGTFTITVTDANDFTYTSGTSGTATSSGSWVRTGLYNVGNTINGPAVAYAIVPVEYCSDANLTNCVQVLPGNTPPSGFSFPAYVRFCQTQAEALAPTAIGDASGTPRCRSKYNETAGITKYLYPRYGFFQRDTIVSSITSYANRPNRSDCAAAPICTYDEELNNYARWYTYYRTRLQMMKSSVGLAFLSFIGNPTGTPPKPNSIRLGLITMHAEDSGTISSSKYLRISDFDTTQASNFYTKFYKLTAANSTPLQEALSRAGWIFAGKLNTGLTNGIPTTDDPIQASCQRNFTLLTTDGYWNNLSSSPPLTPAGKTIGNLDQTPETLLGNTLIDRPITGTLDGTGSSETKFTPTSTQSEQVVCQGNNTANFTIGGPTACGCQPTQHAVIQQDVQTGQLDTYSNGVLTSSTTTTNQVFTNVSGCLTADWTEADTPQTVTEDQVCKRGSNGSRAIFSDGTTVSCSACSFSARYLLVRETKNQTQQVITADGVQTKNNATGATTTYTYSTDGITFSSTEPTGSSCASSAPTSTLVPNPQTVTGVTTNTSGTGTAVAVWSPNPQTTTGGTTTDTFSPGGTASTVADVAAYYFQTKLRGGTDVYGDATGPSTSPNTNPASTVDLSGNDVPVKTGAKDFIPYQHMVTMGIGLADGLMRWQSDYDTATSGDFFNIKSGAIGGCFWTSGACNWPAPANNTSANLDDLWHAAVNGRGVYSQALNADALSKGIGTALTALSSQVASAAASATSSPNVTQTDNQIFSTTYETNTWSGKVFAQTIDPTTGNVNPTIQWEADQNLLSKVSSTSDTRAIYTFDSSVTSTTHIKPFDWVDLTSSEQAYFSNKCTPLSTMSQCSTLTPSQLTTANDGSQLLGYLRGWQAEEGGAFRDRNFIDPITGATANTVLGDTISAKPVYVRNPTLSYTDPGYTAFATANATRAPRVYVAANDGYLHAFDGNTGDESWAYAPGFLLAGMYALADANYSAQHRFYVDGSPESFDVYDATAAAWKTILIGGAGGGGAGFYALDITDPSNPKGLWEFCNDPSLCTNYDTDLGLAYGNPIVGKRNIDGKWVVVLSSGLNNNSGSGTGVGYFYVLDAITGQVLNKVSTGVGNTSTPSGLMKMSAFYNAPATDATFRYVYGTDQLGNVWRLDVGQSASPQCDAPALSSASAPCVTHVATLVDGSGLAQPITTRPALTHISTTTGTSRVLYIGTGRYLGDGNHGGLSDLVDPGAASGVAWQQSLYGFKDKNADYGNLRTGGTLVTQTLTAINSVNLTITSNPVDWNIDDGWLVDFISSGERVNIDPRLVLGTLKVVTNIPAAGGACAVGGSSREYDFDFRTGSALSTASGGIVGSSLGGTIAVGMAIVQLPSGAIKDIITGADTSKTTVNVQLGAGGTAMRRFSYRER